MREAYCEGDICVLKVNPMSSGDIDYSVQDLKCQ